MKRTITPPTLICLSLGCGLLGMALRYLLYAQAADALGLLSSHWASPALWVLTALILAVLLYGTRTIQGPQNILDCFPTSIPAAVGCAAAAVGFLITAFQETTSISFLLSIATALLLFGLGLCCLLGIAPHALLGGGLSACFAIRMVLQYRTWSADPQLMDYCFQLFACVGLMLASYHQGAFGIGLGSHKKLWFWSLTSLYLCCLTPAGPGSPLLYLTCGVWMLTNLTTLVPRPRRQRAKLDLEG